MKSYDLLTFGFKKKLIKKRKGNQNTSGNKNGSQLLIPEPKERLPI